jgi:hypothetical protein
MQAMTDAQLLSLLAASPAPAPQVLCWGGSHQTHLAWQDPDQPAVVLHLPVGPQSLVDQAMRRWPPRPVDLEHAIDLTEEALSALTPQPPPGRVLQLGGAFVSLIAHFGGARRDDVEAAFEDLAAWSAGRPAPPADWPADPGFGAALLLLRELMHHLNFETLSQHPCATVAHVGVSDPRASQ